MKPKFTIIGFNRKKENQEKFYHCAIHQSLRMVPAGEEGKFICPLCGSQQEYTDSEVLSDTKITSRFSINGTGKKIKSLKKKEKKYYDKSGNLINPNDKDIMQDIAQGHTIVSYKTNEIESKEPHKYTVTK